VENGLHSLSSFSFLSTNHKESVDATATVQIRRWLFVNTIYTGKFWLATLVD